MFEDTAVVPETQKSPAEQPLDKNGENGPPEVQVCVSAEQRTDTQPCLCLRQGLGLKVLLSVLVAALLIFGFYFEYLIIVR